MTRTSATVAALGLAAVALLSACTPEPPPDGTFIIDCDPRESAREPADAVGILGPEAYKVGGWSHIVPIGAFETVRQSMGEYKITAEKYLEDPSCQGQRTLELTLVKKTYDWDQQHSNGMEAQFETEQLTFGDVTDLVLELRVRPDDTFIPSARELAAAYGDLLSPEQLAELDAQQVNLELTLFGQGATADHPYMNASVIVSIDQAEFGDQWVRVQIPRSGLTWFTEVNYQRTEVGADAYQDLIVAGLRINPETATGATVRRIVNDENFDPHDRPELFKEMGLTFALIEVGRTTQEAEQPS